MLDLLQIYPSLRVLQYCLMYVLEIHKSRLDSESPGALWKSVLGNLDMLYPKYVGIPVGYVMLCLQSMLSKQCKR